jgi:hypothetical protein
MTRRAPALATLTLALALLTACSGAGDRSGTSAEVTPSPVFPSTTAPTPAPSSDAADQDAEGQDDGDIDVRVQNGRKYADDPVVAQFRELTSAIYRSINGGRLVPELDELGSEQVRDFVQETAEVAWERGWSVPTDPLFRVAVSDETQLKVCVRGDTQHFLDQSGEPVSESDETWYRIVLGVEGAPDAVRFTSYEPEGTCRAS